MGMKNFCGYGSTDLGEKKHIELYTLNEVNCMVFELHLHKAV
jgi:hypothetical protein